MEVAPPYKLLALLTWFTLLILLKLFNTATLQIYILLGKVRTLLELEVELLSKMLGEWVIPLRLL